MVCLHGSQEDVTVRNGCFPNHGAVEYTRQNQIEIKGKIEKSSYSWRPQHSALRLTEGMGGNRVGPQKVEQPWEPSGLADVAGTLHSAAECAFF